MKLNLENYFGFSVSECGPLKADRGSAAITVEKDGRVFNIVTDLDDLRDFLVDLDLYGDVEVSPKYGVTWAKIGRIDPKQLDVGLHLFVCDLIFGEDGPPGKKVIEALMPNLLKLYPEGTTWQTSLDLLNMKIEVTAHKNSLIGLYQNDHGKYEISVKINGGTPNFMELLNVYTFLEIESQNGLLN